MKYKKLLTIGLLFLFIIIICFIPINISTNYKDNNKFNLKTSDTNKIIDYIIDENTLVDSFDSKETKINLRHNNIITNDYNGTYSFINDTINSVPIGWTNLSTGVATAKVISGIGKHDKVVELHSGINPIDDASIQQVFDEGSQTFGNFELWIRSNDVSWNSYFQLLNEATFNIQIRIVSNLIQIHDGSWQDLDTIPLDNIWYHFNLSFDCSTDKTDLWINDYYEGNFDFSIPTVNIDKFRVFMDSYQDYITYIDAIGYSWSNNYSVSENVYPNIQEIDSNILTPDMYQFNFDLNGNPYYKGDISIYGWSVQYTPFCKIDTVGINYYYYSENEAIKNKNAMSISSKTTGSGIYNNSLGIYNDIINITFGLNFRYINPTLQYIFNISIKSIDNIEIIRLSFLPESTNRVKLQYFDGSYTYDLCTFYNLISNDTFNFNLFLYDFDVYLRWYRNDIYNNTYTFPFILERNGINFISFLNYDSIDDSNLMTVRLSYVGIYQYNISLTKEYGCLGYTFNDIWNADIYNLVNFSSYNMVRLISYVYSPYYYPFVLRDFNNQPFIYNVYELPLWRNYTRIWLITNESFNINLLSLNIKGIKMIEYVESIFNKEYIPTQQFYNVNQNNSYFYVNNNQLKYNLHLTLNDTLESISIYFNITNRNSDNGTFVLSGCETHTCFGLTYFSVLYIGLLFPTFITLDKYLSTYFQSLSNARIITEFRFIVNDFLSNNTFTGYIYKGYIYDIKLIYNYIYIPSYSELDIITLSLMRIMIPLILIFIPTLSIYAVYKKKGSIIPILMLFSIIAFATSLIPFQIFFIIMIALGCGIFLQYKTQKEGN